jgi:peptide deformylase
VSKAITGAKIPPSFDGGIFAPVIARGFKKPSKKHILWVQDMKDIVQQDNKVLRQIAKEVPVKDIASPKIQKIISEMKESLLSQDDGVAIAAPQIGVSLRIFVVSHRIFAPKEDGAQLTPKDDLVFINPKIIKFSKKTEWKQGEGCLSVRWLYGEVKRHTNVTIEYFDEKGDEYSRGAGGLLAHIFQHEIDHLDGILFIDKARNVHDLPPEKDGE